MQAPAVLDLSQVPVLMEVILRGGDLHDPGANARQILRNNYRIFSPIYGVYGLSVLINAQPAQAATYDLLAQRNPLFNRKLSLSVIGSVTTALRQAGYGMIIYVTPSSTLPDHHTLAVYDIGEAARAIHHVLPDSAADAIIRAFATVVDNPHPKPRP